MNDTNIDVQNGYNQIAPNATNQIQNFYGFDFAEKLLKTKECPLTLVVLGAGVDATLGLPTSSSLVPRIVEYLESDEGKAVDAALRKAIGNVRFHFDKFVNNAIERLAKDLDKELLTICRNITEELNHNSSLSDDQRKLGNLIIRLFAKIIDIKKGAAIDAETEMLIEEVLGTTVKDDTIIDFTHINYTETFKSIIVEILQKACMRQRIQSFVMYIRISSTSSSCSPTISMAFIQAKSVMCEIISTYHGFYGLTW